MAETRRRAKIVCTIGPASRSEAMLRKLIRAGMDVARLNLSHGEPGDHERVLERIRRLAGEAGRPVAVLLDLQGPKLRVGKLPDEGVRLRRGDRIVLTTRAGAAGPEAVTVSYRDLPADVRTGDTILVDDGRIHLEVLGTASREVRCRVVTGGVLKSHKGVNVPGRKLSTPALTSKDRRDLDFGIGLGVDFVALSFVREAKDLDAVRRVMKRHGASIPVIAKLEKPQAVENLEEIIARADGIMVARGDLGVEVPPERVPVLQKGMIRRARLAGKPVITATQMLESMIEQPRPTRAEASDVANAVFDGTDAVMLSGETAVGKHPVETVRMMARIIETAEGSRSYRLTVRHHGSDEAKDISVPDAIGEAAARAARDLGARGIAVFTQSGSTARLVSKYRPALPIWAFTPEDTVHRRLSLVWGVEPHRIERLPDTDSMIAEVVKVLVGKRRVRSGDLLVVTAGTPVGRPGSTNFIKVHRVET